MSDRSITIWNLLVGFTIVSLIATSFKLFPMNTKYNRLKAAAADLEFGTDKELENIIAYLESRLEERITMHLILKTPHASYQCSCSCNSSGRK